MIKHAWSLVFFTVLGQLGAGLYLGHKLILLLNRFSTNGLQPGSKKMVIISGLLSLLALIVSFTHLGHPKNAFFALSNFRSSWLSKEIFFLAVFLGIILFELVFANSINESNTREFAYAAIGMFVSIAFVFSMIKLYQLETVPGWNTNYTFFNFYNTALLGGFLILLLNNTLKLSPAFNYTILILAFAQVLFFYPFASTIPKISYLPLLFYGLLLISCIVELLGWIPEKGKTFSGMLNIIFFVLGIMFERYVFYATYESVGV